MPQNLPTVPPTDEPQILTPTAIIETESDAEKAVLDEEMFKSVNNCRPCHERMMDVDGNNVSNISDWSSSMMAHAAVDPYYKAAIRAEIARHPEYQAAIEDK